jgi:hypothetical protein
MEKQTLKEWLNSEPNFLENIGTESNPILIIPYDTIQEQLDFLTNETYSTSNFNHIFSIINDNQAVSSSIELKVKYETKDGIVERTLCGAATHSLQFIKNIGNLEGEYHTSNEAYAATSKSLAIVNACKPLGRKFGKYLNLPPKEEIVK